MLLIFLIPLYLLANTYVLSWLVRWMKIVAPAQNGLIIFLGILYGILAFSILFAFLTKIRFITHISNIWFAMFPYLLLSVAMMDVIRIILKYGGNFRWSIEEGKRATNFWGIFCLIFVAILSVYGFLRGKIIKKIFYQVQIKKDYSNKEVLRIVLIADLHLGYNTGYKMMRQMVRKINKEKPDLILIAGDIFDNDYNALKNPHKVAKVLSEAKSTFGTYGCYGNHDISEPILAGFTFGRKKERKSDIRMDEFLKEAKIKLLKDQKELIDKEIYLYGRADYEKPALEQKERKSPVQILAEMDAKKPIIVMDHQPVELQELANLGVDLDVSGHTHGGQMFPASITLKMIWENAYGLKKIGEMTSIVTSGIGVFGPNMRIGTKPEIVIIKTEFN